VDMLKWQRDNMIPAEKAATMEPAELRGKLVVGILHQTQYKEFTYAYDELIKRLYREREENE